MDDVSPSFRCTGWSHVRMYRRLKEESILLFLILFLQVCACDRSNRCVFLSSRLCLEICFQWCGHMVTIDFDVVLLIFLFPVLASPHTLGFPHPFDKALHEHYPPIVPLVSLCRFSDVLSYYVIHLSHFLSPFLHICLVNYVPTFRVKTKHDVNW